MGSVNSIPLGSCLEELAHAQYALVYLAQLFFLLSHSLLKLTLHCAGYPNRLTLCGMILYEPCCGAEPFMVGSGIFTRILLAQAPTLGSEFVPSLA